jgi:hypothetical protein
VNFLSSLFIKKIKQKWLNGKQLCNGVPGGCFQVSLQTSPWATIQMCRWQFRKPLGVPLNLTRGPSPKLNSTHGGGKGGGAYRRRDCSGEVAKGVGEVLRVTAMCGSPSGMVGVGRSTCAGGGARRQRGVQPIQGTIDQSNGSESFTRDQGRCECEELKNGSPDCSVYTRKRVAEVQRGRSWFSGEILSGPRAWEASQAIGEANRATGAAWKRLEWAGHGGRGLGGNGGQKRARWS